MKKFLLLGYGLTNKAVEQFLIKKGYEVKVISDNEKESTISIDDVKKEEYYCVVRSPGVSVHSKTYKYLKKMRMKMISEIELAYRFLNKKVTLIGVTGSNGKTTTVELICSVLSSRYQVYKAGNIGIPFISILDKLQDGDMVVLELSSFQLEDIDKLHLNVSIITSLCPNHLDSVYNLSYYYNSKLNILQNRKKDDLFLTFLDNKEIDKALINKKDVIDLSKYKIKIRKSKLLLKGNHNLNNIKVAYYLGEYFQIERKEIEDSIYNFNPLPHRLEIVGKCGKCLFINDSKATSVEATLTSLKVFKHKVLLIVGGKDKNLDYSKLEKYHPYVFGQIKDKIKTPYKYQNLQEVMKAVFANLKGVRTVLFSPATSSYDQFKNYEERGNVFKKICKEHLDEK